mmetsp:Transcript_13950/g.28799  ORF Transcript_13950/g.28799 Transcript_13950/m.28799 type:complete len:275 (-) Transcript_13950:14-838(-)
MVLLIPEKACLLSEMKHVLGEGSHDLTIVRLDNSTEGRDGSRNLGFGKESEDTQHSKTSVVDFDLKSSGLLLFTLVLAESKRIVKVERNRVRDAIRSRGEVRVVTRLSSLHVVCVLRSAEFTPEFQEGNEGENLPLGGIANSIPECRWVCVVRERGSVHLHGPWEFDSIGMDNVSNEGEHGNTSVLDLSMTQESNGLFVCGSPEFGFSQVQRIVELDNRVKFTSQGFKIGLAFLDSDRTTVVVADRSESGGRGDEGGKDGGLHFRILFYYTEQI